MENTLESDFLSLLINYPEYFERTIITSEYLNGANKILFEILQREYSERKVLIIENMAKHKDFDIAYYCALLSTNIYSSSKEIHFNEFQKLIIEKYKDTQTKELINKYVSETISYKNFYDGLTKLDKLGYQETSYITAKDMYENIFNKDKKINFRFECLTKSLNLVQNDLLVIAGKTGSGKTAFALNLLEDLSKTYPCIYFNLEMSKKLLYKRLVSLRTKIEMSKLNNYETLSIGEKERIKGTLLEYEKRNIALENQSQEINRIRSYIANFKSDKHFIVIIDHIGLISNKGNSSYEKMTEIAKELRRLSLDYNCTIIALCQLSREAAKENQPKLSHLRDSGEIEQSARKVILLNPKDNSNSRNSNIDVYIAKNDDGILTVKEFVFDKHCQHFKESEASKWYLMKD